MSIKNIVKISFAASCIFRLRVEFLDDFVESPAFLSVMMIRWMGACSKIQQSVDRVLSGT